MSAGILAVSLVACGNSSSSSSTDSTTANTTAETSTTEAAVAEGTAAETASTDYESGAELRMIFWDSNQQVGLEKMAEGFMAKYPDITVTVETIPWDNYWTELQASAQGGDMADIVVMHPDEVENYASGGILMDLTDILNGDVANQSNFPDYVVQDFEVDGKLYGIPKDVGTLALFYNKDIFDAAGVDYPTNEWTWDDLTAASEKLTDLDNGIYGMLADNNGQNFYWNLIWQNGGEVWDEENNLCLMDSEEAIGAIEYAVSFIENGQSPTPADFANLTADEYFESGKAAMTYAGSWMLTEYNQIDGLNYDVQELPQGKERAVICSGMAFSVYANTQYPKAAKLLAEYLGSEEAQTLEAESGVAIPAYNGTADPWISQFPEINAKAFVDCTSYGHTSPGLTTSTSDTTKIVDEYMPQIFSLTLPVREGLTEMTQKINESLQ